MKAEQYKELSIKEFAKAATIYDSGHAGIYELCKDDYPPIWEELEKGEFNDLLDVGARAQCSNYYQRNTRTNITLVWSRMAGI